MLVAGWGSLTIEESEGEKIERDCNGLPHSFRKSQQYITPHLLTPNGLDCDMAWHTASIKIILVPPTEDIG